MNEKYFKEIGMNILMLNTEGTGGGAALAANRLATALTRMGHRVDFMVMRKPSDRSTACSKGGRNRYSDIMQRLCFVAERFVVWASLGFKKKRLWEIDYGLMGTDITNAEAFVRADVVHLHWVNQSFLSLGQLQKIIASGKPVVWTMHDLWPATAICHYTRGCRKFETDCRHCGLLPQYEPFDIAHHIYIKKKCIYSSGKICFVGCSRWIAGEARKSGLLQASRVESIPNPIDTELFCPGNRLQARKNLGIESNKKWLLWAAQKLTDPRKGMSLLVEALKIFVERYPNEASEMAVAILGGKAEEAASQIPVETVCIGFLQGESAVISAYRASDAFVLPSTEDNLPNTVMEAMACGLPSIGFSVGGVPEMIVHGKCGYVAKAFDVSDLADGIWQVLFSDNAKSYGMAARDRVVSEYSEQRVAMQFTELYNSMLR